MTDHQTPTTSTAGEPDVRAILVGIRNDLWERMQGDDVVSGDYQQMEAWRDGLADVLAALDAATEAQAQAETARDVAEKALIARQHTDEAKAGYRAGFKAGSLAALAQPGAGERAEAPKEAMGLSGHLIVTGQSSRSPEPSAHQHQWYLERNNIRCHEPGCSAVGRIEEATECYECGQPTEPPAVCPKCSAELRAEPSAPTASAQPTREVDALIALWMEDALHNQSRCERLTLRACALQLRGLFPSAPAQPAPSATEWQPIETAPKRGEVLLLVKERAGIPGKMLVGHYMSGGHCVEDHPPIGRGWYFWNGCMFDNRAEPTHWMPLPAPPADAGPTPAED